MERYEVRVKFDEIRKLSEAGEYKHAMDVADTIDWDRVRNIGMLTVAGEVYERCRYYEDCRAIYERIYEIQPQSRINVYKLANVSVKLKDFESANGYLKEYQEIAPYDPNVLVLTYKIRKGQGAELPELIQILEQLKAKDYHEKWAYELAVMYAEAGEREKCANECDNIFLWFGEGRYVYKALKLKSFFRTLTTAQEQYMNAVSHKPAGAEETVRKAAETADETKEKQSRFMELQREAAGADADSPVGQETLRDLEQARSEAIDASREAKAAELLNEARSEEEQEDAAAAETEDREMLGETKFPTFHLPVMEKIKAPVWRTSMPEPDRSENVPGMEYIDEAVDEAVPAEPYPETERYPEEAENAGMFSELPEDTLSEPDQYTEDFPEDTMPEPEQYTEDFPEDTVPEPEQYTEDLTEDTFSGSDAPPATDPVQYQTMEELLSHADDMKPDDLANALARALSGGQDADRSEEKPEKGMHSPKSLQNVISRIWTRSAARKAEERSSYTSDPELEAADNIDMSSVSPSRYDTLNLQKDLANSINHILNATDKAEIDKTIAVMDRRMLKTNISRYAEASASEEEDAADAGQSDVSDIVQQSMETPDAEDFTRKKEQLFHTLEDEINGQIRMIMETETEDEDIPGQISFEEYIQEKEQAQLEEAKKHAIRIAGDYMEQVTKAVPYIAEEEAKTYLADSQKELLEQARKLMESKNPDPDEIDAVMKSLMMMTAYANEKASDPHDASVIDAAVEAKAEMAAEEAKVHAPEPKAPELIEIPDIPEPVAAMEAMDASDLSDIPETTDLPETEEVPELMEAPETAEVPEAVEAPETAEVPEAVETPETAEVPEAVEAPETAEVPEIVEAPEIAEVPEMAEPPETVEIPETAEMPAAKVSSKSTGLTKNLTEEFSELFQNAPKASDTAAMENILEASIQSDAADILSETIPEETIPEVSKETREMIHENKEKLMDSIADIAPKEVEGLDKEEAKAQVVPMNDEQWEIMDYFMNVPEIEKQIAEFIETQHRKFTNLVICGRAGSGRASLALRLYKSIRVNNPDLPNQTLKVEADSLNKKSVLKVYEKVGKGLILIEHAGMLSSVAVSELIQAMNRTKGSVYTILVSDQGKMERLFEKHPDLAPLFDYTFVIPAYNLDQFVDFGKNYALSYGYVIDDIAQLAFYSAISAKKTKNRLVTLQDVKTIINEAILNNESHSSRLFRGLGSKAKDRDGNIILKERDFS